jgi:hypothetical protein
MAPPEHAIDHLILSQDENIIKKIQSNLGYYRFEDITNQSFAI